MSAVTGLFKSAAKQAAIAQGVNFTTSVYGKPIALIYGVTRASGNLLFYGNFSATGGGSGGGKGGIFGTGKSASQYDYHATFGLAICEGPINGIKTLYQDKAVYSFPVGAYSLFSGTFPQTPFGTAISWSYINAAGSTISGSSTGLGYNGIAYVVGNNADLGGQAVLPNQQFEVQGLGSTSGIGSTSVPADADPSFVLTDVLTNVNHGLGLSTARLGSVTNWQNYCFATGLFVSPWYDTQRTAADIIDELGIATNSAPIWASGQLSMVPYGDQTLTANGKTYTPPSALYSLGDGDFIKSPQSGGNLSGGASGPVVMERKRASDKINAVKLEFIDRTNNYAPAVAYANDQDLIDRYGLRSNGSKQLHLFALSSAANISAQLQLRRSARISNTFFFDLDERYILLDVMDIVQISDSNLGLVNQAVRITQIQENDNNTLSITAEEYLGTLGAPVFNFATGAGFNQNPGAIAVSVNTPIIFEPPFSLLSNTGTVNTSACQIWIAASGNSPLWGGCFVWISLDGTNFTQKGTINSPARMGTISADLATFGGTNPDTINTLSVDLTESAGTLTSGTAADAAAGNLLCIVDSELISFQTAALVSGNKYNLTTLYRGLYGSTIMGHASGAPFARLDDSVFKIDLPAQYVNQALFVVLQSFNVYGTGIQTLASCTIYEFVPAGVAMLHPLGQALNFGSADAGSVTSVANTADDYGQLFALVPGGTEFYFPVAVDLGAFSSTFSLQFVSASSDYLFINYLKTPSQTTFTFAFWVLRATIGAQFLLTQGGIVGGWITFNSSNQIVFTDTAGNALTATTTAITSTTTWHHVCVSVDTTQATAANRVKIYVDGTVQTLSGAQPAQNANEISVTAQVIGAPRVGRNGGTTVTGNYYNGNLAEFYYIDGQQLTPASFISGTPGVPIAFTGSYTGKTDAHLQFINANALGTDTSGENNNYTPINITNANQSQSYP